MTARAGLKLSQACVPFGERRIGGTRLRVEVGGEPVLAAPGSGRPPATGAHVEVIVEPASLHVIDDADGR